LVVLAHLRRRSGRDGFGALSPSRLASSAGFDAFCGSETLFSNTPEAETFSKSKEKEVGEETEANGGHWGDQTRPVSGSSCAQRGALGFATGASGRLRDRRVRSDAQRDNRMRGVDRTQWRVRSRSTGRVRSCVGAYWTQTGRQV
jgi:hypothetical protein